MTTTGYIVSATKGNLCVPVGVADDMQQAQDMKRQVEKASDRVDISPIGEGEQATLDLE